jgi:hypothetical protein
MLARELISPVGIENAKLVVEELAEQLDERHDDGVTIELRFWAEWPHHVMLVCKKDGMTQVAIVQGKAAADCFKHPAAYLPEPQLLWPS